MALSPEIKSRDDYPDIMMIGRIVKGSFLYSRADTSAQRSMLQFIGHGLVGRFSEETFEHAHEPTVTMVTAGRANKSFHSFPEHSDETSVYDQAVEYFDYFREVVQTDFGARNRRELAANMLSADARWLPGTSPMANRRAALRPFFSNIVIYGMTDRKASPPVFQDIFNITVAELPGLLALPKAERLFHMVESLVPEAAMHKIVKEHLVNFPDDKPFVEKYARENPDVAAIAWLH